MTTPLPPLAGLRVLDLGSALAAPFAAMLLGEMGAEVIKIEKPGRGDLIRFTDDYVGKGESGYFLGINRGKDGVTADIRTAVGQRIIRALAAECDVLLENFRSHRMAEWGLSYEQLREVNPRLVYCSVSAFGDARGMEEDGGNDIIGQAYSGLLDVTGEPDRPPSKTGTPVVDASAAMLSTIGVLAALRRRDATGVGEHVQVSLLEAAYALMPNYVVSVLNGEPNYTRQGSGHPQLVPYQAFETRDGKHVVVGAFHRASWRQLCAALGREDLTEDARFKENWDRVKNREVLVAILEPLFRERTRDEWLALFAKHEVISAPVLSIKESMSFFDERIDGLVYETEHAKLGKLRELRAPIRFSGGEATVRRAAPTLGEHTGKRLTQAGFEEQEIAQWKEARLV
ncbi:MAG TPA: CoA transferase [Ramlibacter sp.]|uniref:CaiB/BaiF CoA transferase family protein n=1 Tax=Ramlibacter sp. TaxID=1917967 RepID=UPI002BBA1528|nr:CoA transferase [Ramlibacter sp.]HVZ42222.1 CoA transferase [Ramlibacter sp.]